MIDLKPYEQEMGNPLCFTVEGAERSMTYWVALLAQRHPHGVWTTEPHIKMMGDCVGWYGIFAPLGIVEIPDGVDA